MDHSCVMLFDYACNACPVWSFCLCAIAGVVVVNGNPLCGHISVYGSWASRIKHNSMLTHEWNYWNPVEEGVHSKIQDPALQNKWCNYTVPENK